MDRRSFDSVNELVVILRRQVEAALDWCRCHLLLTALVILALGLRVSNITWGLGLDEFEGRYHPDEWHVVRSVTGFPIWYLSSTLFKYGTALQYSVGFFLMPFKLLWALGYPLCSGLEYGQFANLAVRATNAVLGSLTVVLIYLLGRRIYDTRTGLLAAGLLSVSLLHVMNSGFATLDVSMSFFVTLTILLAGRAFESGTRIDFLMLGIGLGFLAGTKITGALSAIVPVTLLAAAMISSRRSSADISSVGAVSSAEASRPGWKILFKMTAFAFGIAGITLMVSTPHIFIRMPEYLEYMQGQTLHWSDRSGFDFVSVAGTWKRAASEVLTPLVGVLTAIGILVGRFRVRRGESVLEIALVLNIVMYMIFWRGFLAGRFLLPLVPTFCLYAARLPVLLMRSKRTLLRALGYAVACVTIVFSLWACLVSISYRNSTDTRTAAAEYIARNLPHGSTLALGSERPPWPTYRRHPYPEINTIDSEIVSVLDNPEYVVTSESKLAQMEKALDSGWMDESYVWPEEKTGFWTWDPVPSPAEFRFFHELLEGSTYELVRKWSHPPPLPIEFSAPEIRLYRRIFKSIGQESF